MVRNVMCYAVFLRTQGNIRIDTSCGKRKLCKAFKVPWRKLPIKLYRQKCLAASFNEGWLFQEIALNFATERARLKNFSEENVNYKV